MTHGVGVRRASTTKEQAKPADRHSPPGSYGAAQKYVERRLWVLDGAPEYIWIEPSEIY
jgi:hypothetical protein